MGTPFLKTYTTETLLCQMTFRKWLWKFVEAIAMLDPIIVSNVLRVNITCFVLTLYDLSHCILVHFPIYGNQWNDCLITMDGTDYRPPTQGKHFFSFKFRGSGLRYEIGISILGGDIV
jgi:hypothetical protein